MSIRKRIGLLIPSTNTTCESDFQMAVPQDVTVHGQRLWLTNETSSQDGMGRMNEDIESGARYLATANIDIIAYGCTTGSFYRGAGWDREMIDLMEGVAGVPAVATSPAAVEALNSIGARRISVASPYSEWGNRRLRTYLEAAGFSVLNVEAEPIASVAGQQGINDQEPEAVVEFASRVCRAEADALFCSCTAWRAMEAADALEKLTDKPVVTSNQAMVWSVFRALGIEQPVPGFGSLLKNPTVV